MVAPIASAAGSFGRAFARRGARKTRASPRRSSAGGASACALPQLGQWPTPAELSKSLPPCKLVDATTLKLADDAGGRAGADWDKWAEQHHADAALITPVAADRRGVGALAASALHAETLCGCSASAEATASEGGSDDCSDSGAPVDEDRHAAAVKAFLERVHQSRKAGRGDDGELIGLHDCRSDPAIVRPRGQDERWAHIPEKKAVWFNLGLNSIHEVIPYMEIYGRHPREFVFGRHSEMLPAGDRFGFVGLQEDTSADSDELSADHELGSDYDCPQPASQARKNEEIEQR